MVVTYTDPIDTPDEIGTRVAVVTLDYDQKRVLVTLRGNPSNSQDSIIVGSQQDVTAGRAEYTFAQFLTLLPNAATLNTDLETKLVQIGRINPGTVG